MILIISFMLTASIAFRNQTAIMQYFSTDDAFHYFQVAKNIAERNGISFDGIARTNGYHPLWMLICVPVFYLARFDLWLPLRVLIVIQAVLHVGTGFFLYKLLSKKVSQPLAWLAAIVWLFSKAIFLRSGSAGLETGINLFAIALFFHYISKWTEKEECPTLWKKYLIAGVLAAIVLLARLDNIFLVVFVGAWLVLKDSRLNRGLIFIDFFLVAVSGMFSHLVYLGFSDVFYQMMPQIKTVLISSMIALPLGQFLVGIYGLELSIAKKVFVVRILLGVAVAFVFEFLFLAGVYPEGGYSRIVLMISFFVFTIFSIGIKWAFLTEKPRPNSSNQWMPKLKTVFSLNWPAILKSGFAYFIPLFSALGGFLIFNQYYFGAAMPLSGKIKSWWGGFSTVYGHRASNLMEFLGLHQSGPWGIIRKPFSSIPSLPMPLFFLLVGVLVVCLLLLYRESKQFQELVQFFVIIPFTMGICFHSGNYLMTGYIGYRQWYWTIELFYLLVVGVLVLQIMIGFITGKFPLVRKPWLPKSVFGVLSLLVIIPFIGFNITRYPLGASSNASNAMKNTALLQKYTEPGAVIGMTGGGVEAYFLEDRTVVNMDGLINGVDYYELLIEMRLDEYLDRIKVDYVFGKEEMLLESEPYMKPLANRLQSVELTTDDEFNDQMVLYQYLPEN